MITLRKQFKHLPIKVVQEISNPTKSPAEKKYHQKPVLAAGLKQQNRPQIKYVKQKQLVCTGSYQCFRSPPQCNQLKALWTTIVPH